jgi:pimeloyl-ACP methyl ester carboxylesterase
MASAAELASFAGAARRPVGGERTGKLGRARRTFAAMLRAVSFALLLAAALGSPRGAAAADLALERCRLVAEHAPAAFARCGTLAVPENPAAPDGRTVEIFVARVPSLSSSPRPDPLVLIAGGPGESTVDMYLQLRGAFDVARRERDVILVDQRGTGRSAAGFACEVPEDLSLDATGAAKLGSYIDRCVAELEHDPRFYTTSVAVQDLERVRAALGIEQWNLYGVSYGTRVAQHYLRRFPAHTRAVVLDGVVPPEIALGPDIAREAQRALEQIFARCAADDGCRGQFANLPMEFRELLARLEAAPVALPGSAPSAAATDARAVGAAEQFSAPQLRGLVRLLSYNAATIALLPALLHEAYAGNYAPLANQASTTLRGLPESLSFPMSNSVICTEDVPFAAAGARDGLGDTYLGTTIVDALGAICARWPAGAIDADFKTPVVSERPVLLLSGSNDPITPPEYAARVAATLAHSTQLVGRDQGHGLVAIGCVPRLLRAFVENPDKSLDAACLAVESPTPFFLSLLGPGP